MWTRSHSFHRAFDGTSLECLVWALCVGHVRAYCLDAAPMQAPTPLKAGDGLFWGRVQGLLDFMPLASTMVHIGEGLFTLASCAITIAV